MKERPVRRVRYSGSECIPVGYGYDGSGNLTSFQDAAGQITKFSYVSPGQLTWVMYPSHPGVTFVYNAYDSLGRVKTQADAVGHVSTFYFAGSRTEIDDPSGAAQVFYFSPRGKVLGAKPTPGVIRRALPMTVSTV